LLHIAVAAGKGNGQDLATEILRNHPSQRMQFAALQALTENEKSHAGRMFLIDQCITNGSDGMSAAARSLADKLA